MSFHEHEVAYVVREVSAWDLLGIVPWEPTVLPMTDLTIDRARSKLTGLHFAKEALADGERDLLYIAEGLLRLIDERDEQGYAR